MTWGGIPGAAALSTTGVPSSRVRLFASVVRKPPIAGPKPTQTMSTFMLWRSGAKDAEGDSFIRQAGAAWARACRAGSPNPAAKQVGRRRHSAMPPYSKREPSPRIIQRLGNHDLHEGVGRAIFGEARAGETGVHFPPELREWLEGRGGGSLATAAIGGATVGRVVSVDQLGADASGLTGRAGALGGAKVGEEVDQSGQSLGDDGVLGSFPLEFEHVEDLLARGEQPAQRVGQREYNPVTVAGEQLRALGVLGALQVLEGPEPEFHRVGERAGADIGFARGDGAKVDNPRAEKRQEDLVGHGDRDLAALNGLRALIRRLELGIHPLMSEESGAVLGDAVSAHEADGLTHQGGAVTGVPELGGGAEDVGLGIKH